MNRKDEIWLILKKKKLSNVANSWGNLYGYNNIDSILLKRSQDIIGEKLDSKKIVSLVNVVRTGAIVRIIFLLYEAYYLEIKGKYSVWKKFKYRDIEDMSFKWDGKQEKLRISFFEEEDIIIDECFNADRLKQVLGAIKELPDEQTKGSDFIHESNVENIVKINEKKVAIGVLSSSQIILKNPIMQESDELKEAYYCCLKKYLRYWKKEKYVYAQFLLYAQKLLGEEAENIDKVSTIELPKKYVYTLLFDIFSALNYDKKAFHKNMELIQQYVSDFSLNRNEKNIVNIILSAWRGNKAAWEMLKNCWELKDVQEYLFYAEENLNFRNERAYKILITATMSAGKSTFINALTGKKISLSQNLACTSKVHTIISKPFEDNLSYEYDYDLVLDAGKEELLEDNEKNSSDKIIVSTYFNSILGGHRLIINDTPGINYSGDETHAQITKEMIEKKDYDLLIYLLNATQLATNDDFQYLRYIKQMLEGRQILFILNKMDEMQEEDSDILKHAKNYIEKLGFENPAICPVSALAGYMAKKSAKKELSRAEERQICYFENKFAEMKLPEYYTKAFPEIKIEDSEKEEIQLLKNSGLAYVEKIIENLLIEDFCKGGKKYDTDLC